MLLCPWNFSRQEYWSELPLPTPGDLPNPGINLPLLHLLHWQVDSLLLSHQGSPVLSDINILSFSDSFPPLLFSYSMTQMVKNLTAIQETKVWSEFDPGFYIFKLHIIITMVLHSKWLFANFVRLIILLTFEMFSEFKILKKFL